MLACVRAIGQQVIDRLQIGDDATMTTGGKGRLGHYFDLGNGWRIRFSGRTQRESIIEGEPERI